MVEKLNLFGKKYYTVLFFILVSILVFCVGHSDANAIVKWGEYFLYSVVNGDIYNYQNSLQEIGFPTNYGLFVNFITSIELSPILILQLVGIKVPFIVLVTWYKTVLCIVFCVSMRIMQGLSKDINIDYMRFSFLYGFSIVVLFYGIAMGQVDLFAILFLCLALNCYLKNKMYLMSLLLSFSCLIKAFPIIAIVPFFIYLLGRQFLKKEKTKYIIEVIIFLLPLTMERTIEVLLVDDYLSYASLVNRSSFLPKINEINIGGVSLCLILTLVVLIAYFVYIVMKKDEKHFSLLIVINVLYLIFYSLVEYSPQYLVYGLYFLLLMVSQMKNKKMFIVMFGFSLGVCFQALGHFNDMALNAMLVSHSVIGHFFKVQDVFIGDMIGSFLKSVLYIVGRIVVSVSSISVIVAYIMNMGLSIRKGIDEDRVISKVLYVIPLFVYTIVLLLATLVG